LKRRTDAGNCCSKWPQRLAIKFAGTGVIVASIPRKPSDSAPEAIARLSPDHRRKAMTALTANTARG
jgi:hypothetical protein